MNKAAQKVYEAVRKDGKPGALLKVVQLEGQLLCEAGELAAR